MKKEMNDIEKIWHEVNVALAISDFLGAAQRIEKMGYLLKLLRLRIDEVADRPYPMLTFDKSRGCIDGRTTTNSDYS